MFELYNYFFHWICIKHYRYVKLRLCIFGSFQWLLEICHKNFGSSELELEWKLSVGKNENLLDYRKLNFKKQLPSAQNWNFSSCYFWCPCVPRVSSVRTDMTFPVFVTYSIADLQYMVNSYLWTTEKNSALILSRVGLKTAMTMSIWCSTPLTNRATYGRILCKKKQTNKQTIVKWQHFNKWPFRKAYIVRQKDRKSPILGLQFKFPKTHEKANRIIAGNLYLLTLETFFKCAKKKEPFLAYENKVKSSFFNFSRRSLTWL